MTALPDTPITGPAAWLGADLAGSDEWIEGYSEEELVAFERALAALRGRDPEAFDPAEFDLGPFGDRIDGLLATLEYGRGFVLLRGLDLAGRFSRDDATKIYRGIAGRMGGLVSQNGRGHRLGQITDLGDGGVYSRGYATNGGANFHVDNTDIVGLLCLAQGMIGGESLVASSTSLFNTVLAEHPEYAPLLFESLAWDYMDEEPHGSPGWYTRPLYCWVDGHLSGMSPTPRIVSAMRFDEVPRLTGQQMRCFKYMESVLERPGFALEMRLEPGDIQLLSNYLAVHSRRGFFDHPTDRSRRRHLLRLWVDRGDAGRPVCDEIAVMRAGVAPKPPLAATA